MCFVLSSIFSVICAPLLGQRADRQSDGIYWLSLLTIVLVIGGLLVGIAPYLASVPAFISGLLGFFIVLVSYKLSLVVYNAMLRRISANSNSKTLKLSGYGLAYGWLGGIFAVLLSLPLALGVLPQLGKHAGVFSILPASICTAVLSYYAIRKMRVTVHISPPSLEDKQNTQSLYDVLRHTYATPMLFWFFIAYFLFSDGVLTIQNNITIYMDSVLFLSDVGKGVLFIVVLITGALGALASIYIQQFGTINTKLRITIFLCALTGILASIYNNLYWFSFWFSVMGLLNGALWNYSRVYFNSLIPYGSENTYFSVYSVFERFSTFLGPLVWSLVIVMSQGQAELKYRFAWFAMCGLIAIAYFALPKDGISKNE